MAQYFYHRNSGRMYEIVAMNKADGTVTLKNEMAVFTDTFDKDKFKAQGYFPVSGETEADARAAAEAKIEAEEKAA